MPDTSRARLAGPVSTRRRSSIAADAQRTEQRCGGFLHVVHILRRTRRSCLSLTRLTLHLLEVVSLTGQHAPRVLLHVRRQARGRSTPVRGRGGSTRHADTRTVLDGPTISPNVSSSRLLEKAEKVSRSRSRLERPKAESRPLPPNAEPESPNPRRPRPRPRAKPRGSASRRNPLHNMEARRQQPTRKRTRTVNATTRRDTDQITPGTTYVRHPSDPASRRSPRSPEST